MCQYHRLVLRNRIMPMILTKANRMNFHPEIYLHQILLGIDEIPELAGVLLTFSTGF